MILATYVIGRILERGFKKQFKINPFMWKPFDSRFRTIVSRRNIILLIMTAGLILDRLAEAFAVCAVWSIVSIIIQGARYARAIAYSRTSPIRAWLG